MRSSRARSPGCIRAEYRRPPVARQWPATGRPIRDFNLIYAPQRYSARLQWLDVRQPQRLFSSATTVLLFSVAEQLAVSVAGNPWEILGHHDCLHVDNNRSLLEIELQAPNASRCCLIELSEVTA